MDTLIVLSLVLCLAVAITVYCVFFDKSPQKEK